MRRFFNYTFDTLKLEGADISISPFITNVAAFAFFDITAASPADIPLFINIDGTPDDDTLNGTVDADTINGFEGDDTLNGLGGNDIINGGDGTDTIDGGAGDDILDGGFDTNYLTGGAGADTFVVSERGAHISIIEDFEGGIDLIDLSGMGVSSYDQLIPFMSPNGSSLVIDTEWIANSFERLAIENTTAADLSSADFVFDTDPASRTIAGNAFDRSYFGGVGDDSFVGGSGDENVHGGDGDDFINARLGHNIVYGGEGADTFAFSQRSSLWSTRIKDFELGVDVVDLSGFGVSSFDQVLTYTSQVGSDARFSIGTGMGFGQTTEVIIFENIDLASLSASDFVFDTDSTSRVDPNGAGTVFGGLGDDVLRGDSIHGGDGNDTLTGRYSDSTLYGGNGNDILSRGEFQYGGNGDDIVYSIDSTSVNEGGAGIDLLSYAQENDGVTVDLGAGTASRGADGNVNLGFENLEGSSDNDFLTGDDGNNIISGLAGVDRLTGGLGDDTLNGGDGVDTLIGGEGADVLDGGAGFDSADYRGAASSIRFNVDTGGTLGEALGDSFSGIERYYLSGFNDIITGSDANEFFFGEDGDDLINGGGGIDRIYGGAGDDIQRGQDGNDTLYGSAGADQLNGGTGFDVANYSQALSAVGVNLHTGGTLGDATGDSYFGIEAVYGSDFDDNLVGNIGVNELRGGDGDDRIFGQEGNDRLFGGAGADLLNGNAGIDTVFYTTATTGVTLNLATGGAVGDAAGDSFYFVEWVFGSDFDDNITGDAGNNRLEGRDGNDTLNGAGGNDRLLGGDGNDTIAGGDGIDTIFGQAGDDVMTGGAGNDFFFGGEGADSHDGGADVDTVSYLASSSAVMINMQTGGTGGDAAGDSYTNIERIFGTSHDDSITGSVDDDVLLGNGGADFLDGGMGGNDTLIGGAGIDSFGFSATDGGADVISGFFASNEIIYIYDTFGGENGPENFNDLIDSFASEAGANTIFTFTNGSTLTLTGISIADLSASNFDFSGMPQAGEPLNDPDAFAGGPVDVFDMDALI